MENPRTINRIFLALLILYGVVAIGVSIYIGDFSLLLYFAAALALIFGMFGLVSILNVIVFAPIFWIMAKLISHKPKRGG